MVFLTLDMKPRRFTLCLWLVTASIHFMTMPVGGTELMIRQEPYIYAMTLIRNMSTRTFVITARRNSATALAVAHFPLGESTLSRTEQGILLQQMTRRNITRHTPLVVTGYTCPLGPERYNRALSLKRAGVVAAFLRKRGYLVQGIEGRGEQHPVSTIPSRFFENRRAEVHLPDKEEGSWNGEHF